MNIIQENARFKRTRLKVLASQGYDVRTLDMNLKRNELRPSRNWLYGERPVENAAKVPTVIANTSAKGAAVGASSGGGAVKPAFKVSSEILLPTSMAMRPSFDNKSAQDPRHLDYV